MVQLLVFAVLALAVLVFIGFTIRRVWRGRQELFAPPGFAWFWGDGPAAQLAYRRSLPAIGIGFGAGCVLVICYVIWVATGQSSKTWIVAAIGVCLSVFAVMGTIGYWTVPLLNRPKFLVPPAYRGELGMIAARREARRAARLRPRAARKAAKRRPRRRR